MASQKFDPVETLRGLIGESARTKHVEKIGRMLARLIRRDHAFTASYLYNVLSGAQEVGKPLRLALRAYWMAGLGARPKHAGAYEPIELKAIPGNVETGAYVLSHSKRCGNRQCMHPFIPTVPWQKYCSAECRREEENAIKRNSVSMR